MFEAYEDTFAKSYCLGAGLLLFPMLKLQAEHLATNLPSYLAVIQEWFQPLLGITEGMVEHFFYFPLVVFKFIIPKQFTQVLF